MYNYGLMKRLSMEAVVRNGNCFGASIYLLRLGIFRIMYGYMLIQGKIKICVRRNGACGDIRIIDVGEI
jgi:hypothetical protein